MRVWKKLVPVKQEELWLERLQFIGHQRIAVIALPEAKMARIEAYALSQKEAHALVKKFGGRVRHLNDHAFVAQPPRAPIRVRDKLLVVSSERERAICARTFPNRKIILLPAGMAFGTGEHATTSACLRFLADISGELAAEPWDMLDLGTGSGLLAIAAKMLGARRVDALDFDPGCVRIAQENADANNTCIAVKQADVLQWTPSRAWRVVTANLYSEILIRAAKTIARATAPGGTLIFSGVLREQEKECLRMFDGCGFKLDCVIRKAKWVAAKMTKHADMPMMMGSHKNRNARLRILLLALFAAWPLLLHAEQKPDFSTDVRPILSQNCFKCHGADDKARKAKLRLDVPDSALKPAKSGEIAIVPGKADESELVKRVFSTDPDEVMPPPESKKSLTDAEKKILREWVASGAEYKPHWAFVEPIQAPLPEIKGDRLPADLLARWSKNPIDTFVADRLAREGLRPSPEADRYTLVRRVYLDLIGLPPTPEEADAFVNDTAPDAYEKLVDKLLASPHYGERWARRWLDLARYADSNGYEKDRARNIWPYRDWVINALNADMPFDQFTIKQIAGDLLPGATVNDRIATGFHRNTMLNEEGGIDPLEFRFYNIVDRTNTTSTAWLGLTVGCAQCHTHKFDPILQKEYYQLTAFLNNTDEPEFDIPNPDVTKQREEIKKKIVKLTDEMPAKWPVIEPVWKKPEPGEPPRVLPFAAAYAAWEKRESENAVKWTMLRPTEAKTNLPILTVLADNSVLASGDQTKSDTYEVKFNARVRGVTAIRLEALPHPSLPAHGPGHTYYEGPFGDFFLSEFSATANGHPLKFSDASDDYAKGSIQAKIVGAKFTFDGNAQTGWSTSGSVGEPHEAVFNFETPVDLDGDLDIKMLFERHYSCGLGRFRISVTTDAKHAMATPYAAEIETILVKPPAQRTVEEKTKLVRRFLGTTPELAYAREEIKKLRDSMPKLNTTLVMTERPPEHPRDTFIHHRGEFLQLDEKVGPATPKFLPPLPAGAKPDRLTFARWLVSPSNPLTARVTVNRQWQAFFDRGIVRTLDDFGFQGEPPSHPELLDWLAIEFVKEGWSFKKLHRRIVTSATYRQASGGGGVLSKTGTADAGQWRALHERDPDNRLLARGPRFRMDAELIRDSALHASQLLSEQIGGPSVAADPGARRRTLYLSLRRTMPFDLFATFDGPTGERCLARREVSDTPLQALMLLNDKTFVTASQALGNELAARHEPDETRAAWLFRRILIRPPQPDETAMLVDFYRKQKERFVSKKLNPAKIANKGQGDPTERAAWTTVARALLNLDEAVTKS